MSAKKPAPAIDRRSQQAIDIFEKAMKALAKHDYERAREQFDALLEGFPEERDLLERARSYRAVCDRALDKKPAFRPKTFDEMLHHGVYLHNRGEFEEALKFMRQAAEIHPRERKRPLLHGRHRGAGRGQRRPRSSRCAQAVAVSPGQPGPGPRRTRTSTPCARTRSSMSIVYPQASLAGGLIKSGGALTPMRWVVATPDPRSPPLRGAAALCG